MAALSRTVPRLSSEADAYLEAGLRALDRVYTKVGPAPGLPEGSPHRLFLQEEGDKSKTNSGATALTLLSFLERPSHLMQSGDEELLEGLAESLVAMIDDKGAVYELWAEALEGGGVVDEPYYYPGEAMFALALYSERTGNTRWMEAAAAIGRRQIGLAAQPYAIPDHWVMQALEVLDRNDDSPDAPWRTAAYSMGRKYTRELLPAHRAPFPDYLGSYRRETGGPENHRAAARGEAIGAVLRIAQHHNDPVEEWSEAVQAGARHLVEQMWNADNSFFLVDPAEARGAVRMGIIDTHCRIDNNQHAIVALGNALAVYPKDGS